MFRVLFRQESAQVSHCYQSTIDSRLDGLLDGQTLVGNYGQVLFGSNSINVN